MGQMIDITSKLTNEAPRLKIGEKEYEVDNRKNTVLKLNAKIEKEVSTAGIIDDALELLLGKAAAKEIDDLNLRMPDLMTVFMAIMALSTNDDMDEVERRFQGSDKK